MSKINELFHAFIGVLLSCFVVCLFVLFDSLLGLSEQTPEWLDSDSCQKCEQPFFWNFKQMWDSKKIGLRQV